MPYGSFAFLFQSSRCPALAQVAGSKRVHALWAARPRARDAAAAACRGRAAWRAARLR